MRDSKSCHRFERSSLRARSLLLRTLALMVGFGAASSPLAAQPWMAGSGVQVQPRPPPSPPKIDPKRELARGDAPFAAHRYDEAIAAYQSAEKAELAAAFAGEARALIAQGRRRDALFALRRAAFYETDAAKRSGYLVEVGDLWREFGERDRAADAYLEALRTDANEAARNGYRALGVDAFGHEYAFAAAQIEATDVPPGLRSGLAGTLGSGTGYGEVGLGLEYAWREHYRPFGFSLHAAAGLGFPGHRLGARFAPAAGALISYGMRGRWVLDLSYSVVGYYQLKLHGTWVAARPVYGPSLSAGRDFYVSAHWFFRALLGAALAIDRVAPVRVELAATTALGWQP